MARIKLLITLAVLTVVYASCSTSKNSAKGKNEKNVASIAECRLLVSFYSIGSGKNAQAHDKFDAFIDKTNKEKNITLNTGATPWGREGEVDYCFKLTELTASQQKKFINDLKNLLKGADFVRIEEDKPNKNKR